MSNSLAKRLSSRRRGPNFSSQEKAALMGILRTNPNLKQEALSAKSDTASLHRKARAWTEITNRFKSTSREVPRTTDQLKVLWKNLVASARARAKQASGVCTGAELLKDKILQDDTLTSNCDYDPDNVLATSFSSIDSATAIDADVQIVKPDSDEIFELPSLSCTEQQVFHVVASATVGVLGPKTDMTYPAVSGETECSESLLHNNEMAPAATEYGPEPESSVILDMNMGSSEGYDDDPALAGYNEGVKPKSEAAAQRLYEIQQKFAEKEQKAKMLLMKTKYEYVALKKYRLEHELRLSSTFNESSFRQHFNSKWTSAVEDNENEEEVID